MKAFRKLALAVLFIAFSASAQAATVANGSFEDIGSRSLNGSGWNHFSDVPGWTGVPNVEIQSNNTLGSIDAQDGTRYAELDTNQDAGIYQDIILNAGKYALSFWYSPRVNDLERPTTNDMDFFVGTIDGAVSFLDGSVSGAPSLTYPHGVWTKVNGNFEISADTTVRLSFFATGGSAYPGCGNCGALIDNVSIASVPVPAAGLLLLSALGGAAVMRRRKVKRAS